MRAGAIPRTVLTVIVLAVVAIAVIAAVETLTTLAFGRDNAEWEATPGHVRLWYQQLMQPDHPDWSCCGEADAYFADDFETSADGEYVAIITDEREIPNRVSRPAGTKIVIPNHKIKWDAGNPTGHGVVFIGTSEGDPQFVYCYVAPGGV